MWGKPWQSHILLQTSIHRGHWLLERDIFLTAIVYEKTARLRRARQNKDMRGIYTDILKTFVCILCSSKAWSFDIRFVYTYNSARAHRHMQNSMSLQSTARPLKATKPVRLASCQRLPHPSQTTPPQPSCSRLLSTNPSMTYSMLPAFSQSSTPFGLIVMTWVAELTDQLCPSFSSFSLCCRIVAIAAHGAWRFRQEWSVFVCHHTHLIGAAMIVLN